MSRSTNPFIQAWETKPAEITLETLPQLFAHHRARFGDATMTQTAAEGGGAGQGAGDQGGAGQQAAGGQGSGQAAGQGGGQQPPERPEGVSEAEWAALGDPGRVAITRERDARQAAERALAAARARPAPPGPAGGQGAGDQGQQNAGQGAGQGGQGGQQNAGQGAGKDNQVDVGAIVKQAVEAALQPFQQREEQRDADAAVQRIQTSVLDAAKDTFLDPTDALTGIDLTQVTDGTGNVDPAKVDTQLKDLLIRKPHLAKSPDGRRYATTGSGAGAGGAGPNLESKVQETLSRMQTAAGLKQTAT